MKNQLLIPMNLQFFADEEMEESGNIQEVAEPVDNLQDDTVLDNSESATLDEEVVEESQSVQSEEQNRAFANMRREAEKKAKAEQEKIDRM